MPTTDPARFWYPSPRRYAALAESRYAAKRRSERLWSEDEERELRRLWAAGISPAAIGDQLGRRSQEVLERVRACLELARRTDPPFPLVEEETAP